MNDKKYKKIEHTGIKCLKCGQELFSRHRHDMVWCGCKSCAVDGGLDYLKITGDVKNFKTIKKDFYVRIK